MSDTQVADDFAGRTFGRLTAVREALPRRADRRARWLCRCACGTECVRRKDHLLTGNALSCGCLSKEITARGVQKGHPAEYTAWAGMWSMCRHRGHRYVGGKGVTVHPAWADFHTFLRDLGPKPTPGGHLTRIDKAKPYEPGNAVWSPGHARRRPIPADATPAAEMLRLRVVLMNRLAVRRPGAARRPAGPSDADRLRRLAAAGATVLECDCLALAAEDGGDAAAAARHLRRAIALADRTRRPDPCARQLHMPVAQRARRRRLARLEAAARPRQAARRAG